MGGGAVAGCWAIAAPASKTVVAMAANPVRIMCASRLSPSLSRHHACCRAGDSPPAIGDCIGTGQTAGRQSQDCSMRLHQLCEQEKPVKYSVYFAFAILGESSSLFHSVQWGRAVPGPVEAVLTKCRMSCVSETPLHWPRALPLAVRAEALQFAYVSERWHGSAWRSRRQGERSDRRRRSGQPSGSGLSRAVRDAVAIWTPAVIRSPQTRFFVEHGARRIARGTSWPPHAAGSGLLRMEVDRRLQAVGLTRARRAVGHSGGWCRLLLDCPHLELGRHRCRYDVAAADRQSPPAQRRDPRASHRCWAGP